MGTNASRTFWGLSKFDHMKGEYVLLDYVQFNALDVAPFDATNGPGLYYDSTTGLMASDGTNWNVVTTS